METKRTSYTISKDKRHEIILEALEAGGKHGEFSAVARRHGLNRNTLYRYLKFVLDRPYERMVEAESEAAFRRKVWELLR